MALRVLTQVNYSAGENPEGDSGLHFTAGLLRAVAKLDPDLHFHVLVPAKHEGIWAAALSHARITALPIDMEPRLHGGDFQFCPARLTEVLDLRRVDFDVLFLNQPETAPAFLQFFNRQTFHNVPAIAYVHWFDTRRPATPKETLHLPALLGALTGMMASTIVGCNSNYGRERILTAAERWFHGDAIRSLSNSIRCLPPGIDVAELNRMRAPLHRRRHGQILVNHRLLKYTGVRALLSEAFPKLWAQRQDFSVVVTNPTRVRLPATITRAPWLSVRTLDRDDYLRTLWESDLVIAPHRACHWSISTMEAICAGCVPLMNQESFFLELMSPLLDGFSDADSAHMRAAWFYYRGNLTSRLSDLLDNLPAERWLAQQLASRARLVYDWASIAPAWLQAFYDAESRIPAMSMQNPSMRRIIALLRNGEVVSKADILKHLRWAPKQRALSWTSFRKSLKQIAFDDPASADAVFELISHPAAQSARASGSSPHDGDTNWTRGTLELSSSSAAPTGAQATIGHGNFPTNLGGRK